MTTTKVSIITVVYNDVKNIRSTIESYLSQSYDNKEYIIIDGGSNDGTMDIVNLYRDRIDVVVSEPDKGIYDAMNKGIKRATGNWIGILNSGDTFVSTDTLKTVFSLDWTGVDVIYGNSKEVGDFVKDIIASPDTSLLEFYPIYRHGSSFVRAELHKANLFDLSKKSAYKYGLDWLLIHTLYKNGCRFKKVDTFVEQYELEGTSNHPYRNRWINYKVTTSRNWSAAKLMILLKGIVFLAITQSWLYRWTRGFVLNYLTNDLMHCIPFWNIRRLFFKTLHMKIGKGSFVMKNVYIMMPNNIKLGTYSHINRGCVLDARGGISIGNSVSISHDVHIMTGSHDIQSRHFVGLFKPVVIDDYAFLGVGCTILQGINIGRGAVVCAGAVVTKDVKPFEIVGGVPAKAIGKRTEDLDYHCIWNEPFT